MENVSNPFVGSNENAARYDEFRPHYHHIPFEKLVRKARLKLGTALDVACGTGHATRALEAHCSDVVATDISKEMIEIAKKSGSKARYVISPAEVCPFEDAAFDLVNISMGFHWVDQEKFLREAHRVLRKGALLSVDNFWFTSEMVEFSEFKNFHNSFYIKNFPMPSRKSAYPEDEMLKIAQFENFCEIAFDQKAKMSLQHFVSYLMTQSNTIASKSFGIEKTRIQLEKEYGAFFEEERSLCFSGLMKVYRKI